MDDRQLLEDYLTSKSEAAFRTLVERHVGLVHGAAQRHVNNSALAEEITQAVFILLARKAPTLPLAVTIVGWLFRTTRFVASRALRAEIRRQRREQEALAMQELSVPDDIWRRLAPVIDEALDGLDARERDAVLLRYFEDRNHREVGAALGITEEAAKKRVQRGLEKLRTRLTARGLTLSAVALGSALAAHAAPKVATEFASMVASGVFTAQSASTTVAAFVQDTWSAWETTRWKATTWWAGAGAVVTGITVTLFLHGHFTNTSPIRSNVGGIAATSNTSLTARTATQRAGPRRGRAVPAERALRFRVVAADTGEPATQAGLAVNVVAGGEWQKRFDLITDAQGWCDVPYPADAGRLDVGVWSAGWAARFATWYVGQADLIPAEYVLKASRVTNALGGWVRDEQGQPVANAEIWAEFHGTGDHSEVLPPRERIGFVDAGVCARSDRNGFWTCAMMPASHRGYQLEARHPDYPKATIASIDSASSEELVETTTNNAFRQLVAHQKITVLRQGLTLRGRLLDVAGNPIRTGKVTVGEQQPVYGADAEGRFQFSHLTAGTFAFTAMADGFSPERRSVDVSAGMDPIEVRMEPGGVLRLLTLDQNDQPVAGTRIVLEGWSAGRWLLEWETRTGPDGRLEWRSAPAHGNLELCAVRDGYCYTREINVPANGEQHIVRMRPQLLLSGHVTDAATGEPIASFNVLPGYGTGRHDWHRSELRRGANGIFELPFRENRLPWRARLEAEGYEPWISEPLPAEPAPPLEIALQRADPKSAIRGIVVRPDGQPAAGAQVVLLTLEHNVRLVNTHFERDDGQFLCVQAGADGQFSFAPDPKAHSAAAVSADGYARLRVRDTKEPVRITLEPWGRLEGSIGPQIQTKPVRTVAFDDTLFGHYEGRVILDFSESQASPDAEGRFTFRRVPPGDFDLVLTHGDNQTVTHRTAVTIVPGRMTQVQIQPVGRTVTGRIVAASGEALDFANHLVRGYFQPVLPAPPKPGGLDGVAADFWMVDFFQSPEGRQYVRRKVSWPLQVNADGSFRVEEVLPGPYLLKVFGGGRTREVNQIIDLPEASGPDDPMVDLGDIKAQPGS